ncbi:ABC transporter ATP-binding protein [Brucella intermedia]|uniref:ABC transporter ATP-binding protein n=1 Tax=Brucella intermedia TaxID=94625 RepID=UPI00224AF7AB|nr:ABC transporter ATP-binding protein [Brucella intermedia]
MTETRTTSPVLAVDALNIALSGENGWQPIVHDLSFRIDRGETLAIVGESGSGKSVTANAVMGLLPRLRSRIDGGIRLEGREILGLPESDLRRIRGRDMAMVFQEASLNPTLTIGFQLMEMLRAHSALSRGGARSEAKRLLDRVRIPAAERRLDDYPHQMSGGMRQRVAIAMALACRPRLLIADEPTTALDVTVQAQILDLIKALQDEEDMSVMFITHDMGVVAEMADRILVMRHGRAVETGNAAALLTTPQAAYTRELLAAVPQLGETANAVRPVSRTSTEESSEPVLSVEDIRVRFDMRGGLLNRVQGRVHAVEDVSFRLKAGETLSIVGESGCGKSSLARTIMGLTTPAAGTVAMAGSDISAQMVFQDPIASLDARMRVGDAIAEPLLQHGALSRAEVNARVIQLLGQVGLSRDLAARFPHQLSGGQCQRICIARALALNPRLIVADEAVSALDVSIKTQVIDLMMDLQQRFGIAFLFISHDMAVVERISHRVAVMYMGRIVEIGPRAAIFGNPAHPYTRRLLSAVPVMDPARRHLRRPLSVEEIPNPLRPLDYAAPPSRMVAVEPDHFILDPEIDTEMQPPLSPLQD